MKLIHEPTLITDEQTPHFFRYLSKTHPYGQYIKALNFLKESKITELNGGFYKVKSSYLTYNIDWNDLTCDCQWYRTRFQKCSHMLAVQMYRRKNGLDLKVYE